MRCAECNNCYYSAATILPLLWAPATIIATSPCCCYSAATIGSRYYYRYCSSIATAAGYFFYAVVRLAFSSIGLARKELQRSNGTHGQVQRRTHDGTSMYLEIAPFLSNTFATRCDKLFLPYSINNASHVAGTGKVTGPNTPWAVGNNLFVCMKNGSVPCILTFLPGVTEP